MWFTDPADKKRDIIIGYLVRVIQDPEEKTRLDVKYKKLAADINCMFPDSRIELVACSATNWSYEARPRTSPKPLKSCASPAPTPRGSKRNRPSAT